VYTRQEASLIRKEFWTILGQYMAPVGSVSGEKVHWINYKTGVKHFHFRLDATDGKALIALELDHPDLEIQQLYFNMLEELKPLFQGIMQESWDWTLLRALDSGKIVSRIYRELDEVEVLNRQHWPSMISFFKQSLIRLDEFWWVARDHVMH